MGLKALVAAGLVLSAARSLNARGQDVIEVPCCDATVLRDALYDDDGNPETGKTFVLGPGTWNVDFRVILADSKLEGSTQLHIHYDTGCETTDTCYDTANATIFDFGDLPLYLWTPAMELRGTASVEGLVVQNGVGSGLGQAGTDTRVEGSVARDFGGADFTCLARQAGQTVSCTVDGSVAENSYIGLWGAPVHATSTTVEPLDDVIRSIRWDGNLVLDQFGASMNSTMSYGSTGDQVTTSTRDNTLVGRASLICNTFHSFDADITGNSATWISEGDRFVGPPWDWAVQLWYGQKTPYDITDNTCSVTMRDPVFEGWWIDVLIAGTEFNYTERGGTPLQVKDDDIHLDIRDADACNSSGGVYVFGVSPTSTVAPDGVNQQPANVSVTQEDNACLDFSTVDAQYLTDDPEPSRERNFVAHHQGLLPVRACSPRPGSARHRGELAEACAGSGRSP